METVLALEGVTRRYAETVALDDLSFAVPSGSAVALLGPNGAGKTTTVSLLMGLAAADAGSVTVCGTTPRAAVASGRIAAMLQDSGLMPGATVGELVELARRCAPDPLPAAEALELSGLSGLARRRADRLSGGQAQRLKFALVAAANPRILVLDEPTRALDVQARARFWEAMRAYAAGGRTILFATHYLDEVDRNAGRVLVMSRGRIVADGTPAQLRERGGRSVVGFRLDDPKAENVAGVLAALPGSVMAEGDRVSVQTDDPDATVRALAAGPLCWHALSIAAPSLEESFLSLTAGPSPISATSREES
ncbi:MAG TPA: ABC transporter ATP-binding protein [Actinocrinis sp.]|jgi:ABC-2 type transport system ATP-binding protein